MKRKQIIYYSIILMLTSFGGIKAQPKVLVNEELYFPLVSKEFMQRHSDCLAERKSLCQDLTPNDSLMKFTNQWYSRHLSRSNEPILYDKKDTGIKSIRFMLLGSWAHPLSYRIENTDGKITYTYNKTKGQGGFIGEVEFEHEEKTIQLDSWTKILAQIEHIDFWNINTHDPRLILDGEIWVLEVLIDGKYHFVTRNTPASFGDEAYAELCKLVRDAAK